MTRRVWWDAATLAVVAAAVVAGLATGSGAAKPDPAPTACVPTEYNGGVCSHGQLVFPTDGAGDLPGQSPAAPDGSRPTGLEPSTARPRPASTPSRAHPSMLPSDACAHPEDINPPMSREYLRKLGLC